MLKFIPLLSLSRCFYILSIANYQGVNHRQSPLQIGNSERAGESLKRQLWDVDEEIDISGKEEIEDSVAECCDARNRD